MSQTIRSDVGVVQMGVETTAGTLSSNLVRYPVRERPSTEGLKRTTHEHGYLRAIPVAGKNIVGLSNQATLPIGGYLRGWSSVVPANHPVLLWPGVAGTNQPDEAYAFASALGNIRVSGSGGAATVTGTGDDAGILVVVSTTGYLAGDAVAVNVAGAGLTAQYEVGWVKKVTDATHLELRAPLSAIPQDLAVVHGCTVVWPSITSSLVVKPISWTVQGEESYGAVDPQWQCLGGRANSISMKGAASGFAEWDAEYLFQAASRVDAGQAISYGNYAFPEREVLRSSEIVLYESVLGRLARDPSEVTLDLGLDPRRSDDLTTSTAVQDGGSGINAPMLTMDPLYTSDLQEWALYAAQTSTDVRFSIGTQPGRLVASTMPAAVVKEDPTEGARGNNHRTQGQIWMPAEYTSDVTSGDVEIAWNNTNAGGAPYAIAWL